MPIFDSAIFDGPIIFDTGGAAVPRISPLAQAQIHGIKGNASIHDTQGTSRVTN